MWQAQRLIIQPRVFLRLVATIQPGEYTMHWTSGQCAVVKPSLFKDLYRRMWSGDNRERFAAKVEKAVADMRTFSDLMLQISSSSGSSGDNDDERKTKDGGGGGGGDLKRLLTGVHDDLKAASVGIRNSVLYEPYSTDGEFRQRMIDCLADPLDAYVAQLSKHLKAE